MDNDRPLVRKIVMSGHQDCGVSESISDGYFALCEGEISNMVFRTCASDLTILAGNMTLPDICRNCGETLSNNGLCQICFDSFLDSELWTEPKDDELDEAAVTLGSEWLLKDTRYSRLDREGNTPVGVDSCYQAVDTWFGADSPFDEAQDSLFTLQNSYESRALGCDSGWDAPCFATMVDL